MLRTFFNTVYFENYIPQARHMFYPVLMLAVGTKCFTDYGWEFFGITMYVIGVPFAFVIMLGIAWRGPIEYWSQIEKTISVMNRIKDPAVWTSMGFRDIPEVITIEERKTDERGDFVGFSYRKMAVNPAVLNAIANKVMLSKNFDFTEELYGDKVKNFRKVRKDFIDKGYVTTKNKKNVRGGYRFTKKGVDVLYEYADAAVLKIIQKGEDNDPGKE